MADKSNLGKVVELLLDLEGFLLDNESFPPWYDVLRHMVEAGNPYEFPHNSWVVRAVGSKTEREIMESIYSMYSIDDEYAVDALKSFSVSQSQKEFSAVALTKRQLGLDDDGTFGGMVTAGEKLGLIPMTAEDTIRFLYQIPLAIIAIRSWILFSTNFGSDFLLGAFDDEGPTLGGFSPGATYSGGLVMVFKKPN